MRRSGTRTAGWPTAAHGALATAAAFLLVPAPAGARAWCFDEAAAATGLSPDLLRAVAAAESNFNPRAVNDSHAATTKTRDIGLMQINTSWLPVLKRHGIAEGDLFEPCTNIRVGAWILADLIGRMGDNWDAVGAYNAGCTQLRGPSCTAARSRYAWRVHRRLARAAETTAAPTAVREAGARPAPTRPAGLVLVQVAHSTAATAADAPPSANADQHPGELP
ncbi:MAG: lytic transglycosylase domain-containing protein [Rubrivivax sp.]